MEFDLIISALVGLAVGGFLNIIIVRYPKLLKTQQERNARNILKLPDKKKHRNNNLFKPRPHCSKCRKTLLPWYNVPLFSYLFLKGKCAYCQAKIPTRYLFVELLTAAISTLVIAQFDVNCAGILALLLTWALISLVFLDIRAYILPDEIILPILWIGLISNAFQTYTYAMDAIIATVIAYLILWLIAQGDRLIRKKTSLKQCDFKIFAMLGAWQGTALIPVILIIAILIGIIVKLSLMTFKKSFSISFGTYIAISGWLSLLYGSYLIHWIKGW